MLFKVLFILIFLVAIYFGELSIRKYKGLNFQEKELKLELFAKRTNFVIFVAILNIILLILLVRFIAEFSRYFYVLTILFWIVFDYFDSKNKIAILRRNDFSNEFLIDYIKSTNLQIMSLVLFFVLTLLGLFYSFSF